MDELSKKRNEKEQLADELLDIFMPRVSKGLPEEINGIISSERKALKVRLRLASVESLEAAIKKFKAKNV